MKKVPKLYMMPLADENLVHYLKRAHLQSMIWKAADQDIPLRANSQQYGWKLEDGILQPSVECHPLDPSSIMRVIPATAIVQESSRLHNCIIV